ncbi:MAG: restriction endonuclease subunit S [Candidatus Electrothrix scaldis]|nr:MAG: restriction endonuclease subunit S [Candidatus Electrothrix sp. GW3-3]
MSWKQVVLSDVCEVVAGQSPPSSTYNKDGFGYPFFQGKADFGAIHPSINTWCSKPKKIARPNDVLLSVRAPVGPTNICNVEAAIGRGLSAIRVSGDIIYTYLLHFLRSYAPILASKGSGSTFAAITQKDVKNIPIPLPPLEEQYRIVELLGRAQALIDKRKEQIALMDQLVQSLFYDMFGDPLTNPKGWPLKRLGDIGNIQTGNTPSRKEAENYGDHIEWLKTDNILSDSWYVEEAKEKLSVEGEKKARIVESGSILVCCIAGSPQSIGRAGMTNRRVAFNQQINSISPKKIMNSIFLLYHFRVGQKLVQQASTASMKGMVNKTAFSNILFCVPPIELQNTFAERVQQIETQKQAMTNSLKELQDNFNSLSQRAFKGELTQ